MEILRYAHNDRWGELRMMVLLGLPRFARNDSELLEGELLPLHFAQGQNDIKSDGPPG
jgi:hypothetical protein